MLETILLTSVLTLAEDADASAQQTQRDQRAVAIHRLEQEGIDPTTPRRELHQALVDREVEVRAMRSRLADMEIQLAQLQAQLTEMQTFVLDHDRYGTDFSQYQQVREDARKEVRRREALERQARRELARQQQEEARAKQEAQKQLAAPGKDLQSTLQKMNFGHLGQDVWRSRAAYHYAVVDRPGETITYRPSPFGGKRVVTEHQKELDWSEMTISGSLLNAAKETRNIGIAVAFFDEYGNQVGAETIVVNNARPGVPYPFTQTLEMAANKPFASDTAWVLFADPISTAAGQPPSTPLAPNAP
ncbi:MAG: hypothetical protein MK101_02145 [Phycisphaerales bacterium]|nr:hypothetical protein [Phycisphaerales bacterium]